jgi:hypothetical protein
MRKIKSAFIGRNKEMGFTNSERVTHTKKIIQLKAFVPGVGKYKPNYNAESKPYMKKRY